MREITAFDEQMMQHALELSMKGRITAPPNPWVGCVIVNHGAIVGEGFHRKAGEPHAEVNALMMAKDKANGGTAYVTLEPCSHYGRTPPCCHALIDAKVSRVVIGIQDPDPKVQSKGIAQLQAAGIKVVQGVCAEAISKALSPYLYHRRTGLSYCLAKGAISIDGRIAAADGTSQWITGNEAQQDSHQLRAESQAIIVGARTACADNPHLTVRNVSIMPPTPPLRVILDAQGIILKANSLFDTTAAPTLIVTSENCPEKVQRMWQEHGIEVAIVPKAANQVGVNLHHTLKLLGSKGIIQVLVEGGGTLLGSFLEANLIQRFSLYVGPRILGSGGIPLFRTNTIKTLKEAPTLTFLETKTCGSTVRIDYAIEKGKEMDDFNTEVPRHREK